MIRADDRVAAVLARDERLLEVLVAASPAFARLRDARARDTMARLVTVEQAARIAGVEAAALLERLNAALDGAAPAPAPRTPAAPAAALPAALAATPPARIVELDVRDELRAGREPLRQILDAARALPPDGVLRLRATFEPAPLYAVLGKQGLAHWTEPLGADDWRVWFYRDGAAIGAGVSPAPGPDGPPAPGGDGDGAVVVLDVRGLEPPEPMERTLEALATLPPGATLVQLNVRVPRFLLPQLEQRGFTCEIREQSAELVRLFIRHRQP